MLFYLSFSLPFSLINFAMVKHHINYRLHKQHTRTRADMGQTLQRAAHWTSAKEGLPGKLEFTSLNEDLLKTILKFVEGGQVTTTGDERRLVFKKPLTWATQLKPSAFAGAGYSYSER